MVKCDYCGKEITPYLVFKCGFCGGAYCVKHHLPENHECRGLRTKFESLEDIETRLVNSFVNDVSYVRSIDGLLIKFGSLISSIKKLAFSLDYTSTKQIFRRILFNEKVLKSLSSFSDYADVIRIMVKTDPRHLSLRDYVDGITDALNEAKKYRVSKVERTIELMRPTLREIEVSEKAMHRELGAPTTSTLSYKKAYRRKKVALKSIAIVLVAFLVLVSLTFRIS